MVSPGATRTEPSPMPATSVIASSDEADRGNGARPASDAAGETDRSEVRCRDAGRHRRSRRRGECSVRVDAPAPGCADPVGRRGPGRVISVSWTGRTSSSLTAVIDVPPGAGGHAVGRRHVERVRAEDDDLRVALDELLERDRVARRVAGGDRVAAGERDHLGDERLVGRPEDLARGVGVADLVEDPRLSSPDAVAAAAIASISDCIDSVMAVGLVGLPDGVADELDVVVDPVDRRRVDDEDRDAEPAKLGDGLRAG